MMKSFVHPSILNIFITFPESNAHMMPGFLNTKTEYRKPGFEIT